MILASLRSWREAAIGVLLIVIALLGTSRAHLQHRNQRLIAQLAEVNALLGDERNLVRSRTAAAKAADADHAARVEAEQTRASQEIRNDYEKQLADFRRRHDAVRLHPAPSGSDRSRCGGASVPRLPQSAGGADGAASDPGFSGGEGILVGDEALIASEQALRLKALQEWVRAQSAVPR